MPPFETRQLPYFPDSEHYFQRLHTLPGAVWLDSGRPSDRAQYSNSNISARYDIMTALPREQIVGTDSGCRITDRDGLVSESEQSALDYLDAQFQVRRAALEYRDTDVDLPFCGGAVGYLAYEALHETFGLAKRTGEPDLPDAWFGLYDWGLIQDHHKQQTWLVSHSSYPTSEIKHLLDRLQQPAGTPDFSCGPLQPDIGKAEYVSAVKRVQDYILAGDCYQVNYTQRFTGPFSGSPASAYLGLRQKLSGPFSAYLATPAGSILSLSPERFIEQHGRRIKTQPIKGTTARGTTPAADAAQAAQLQQSEKDRAENVMIVDLLRNDFSKICQPFSVEVVELFGLQSFANVHHLVSTIEGELDTDSSTFDVFRACFPGGSITGAPKKRAMEIIDELEQFRRGLYCGSVVYFSYNGRMDSSIAIRTLVQRDDRIYCWGGGGVVADSDPDSEYQESLHKIGVLLRSLNQED